MVRGWRAGDGGWSAEAPTDRGRKPAGGLRMARGIVFSSLELTYFGKRNIYQAKWACGS